MKYKLFIGLGIVVVLIVGLVVIQFLIIKYNGKPVAVPNIPRGPESYGAEGAPKLTYVVLGDSTTVGQGGDYDYGIARSTARHLAANNRVLFQNFGISGARAADVVNNQLQQAVVLKPDVVMLAITANDVTHFTSIKSVRASLITTIDSLRTANPNVKIVLTGSPAMGSVPRFPQPTRFIAGQRTASMNKMIENLSTEKRVTFAYLAKQTGNTFAEHPELFAQDQFHPTTEGYDVWVPVLNRALDTAVR